MLDRFIFEVKGLNVSKEFFVDLNCSHLIIRKKTISTEIDIGINNFSKVLSKIRSHFVLVDVRQLVEETHEPRPTINQIELSLLESEILSSQERFWEIHTRLETVWRFSDRKYKTFLHSIIQIASSQVKYQMGNKRVAEVMYLRGVSELKKTELVTMIDFELSDTFVYPIELKFNVSDDTVTSFYEEKFIKK
ncbi:MAG: DUF309 domain-containing protein [Candidatus Thermoplasmatota archaeon]|jgi:hypothetical protein|nr:DUF309 domain-containing protein [Candidatus Thermoplasmatota archaeon]